MMRVVEMPVLADNTALRGLSCYKAINDTSVFGKWLKWQLACVFGHTAEMMMYGKKKA